MTNIFWLDSFILGILFCAPPGVVAAEAIRRGIARGFQPALMVELGSLVGDATWALIALLGLAVLMQYTLAKVILGVFGVWFLLKLAWGALKDARAGGMPQSTLQSGARGDFAIGAVLSLSNPYAVGFWLSLGGSFLSKYVSKPSLSDYTVFFVSFMAAATVYCFFMAGMITFGRRFVNEQFFRVVNLVCGVAIAYFAFTLAQSLVSELMQLAAR